MGKNNNTYKNKREGFAEAVLGGDLEQIRKYVECRGCSPRNTLKKAHDHAILVAAKRGYIDVVRYFIKDCGTSVDTVFTYDAGSKVQVKLDTHWRSKSKKIERRDVLTEVLLQRRYEWADCEMVKFLTKEMGANVNRRVCNANAMEILLASYNPLMMKKDIDTEHNSIIEDLIAFFIREKDVALEMDKKTFQLFTDTFLERKKKCIAFWDLMLDCQSHVYIFPTTSNRSFDRDYYMSTRTPMWVLKKIICRMCDDAYPSECGGVPSLDKIYIVKQGFSCVVPATTYAQQQQQQQHFSQRKVDEHNNITLENWRGHSAFSKFFSCLQVLTDDLELGMGFRTFSSSGSKDSITIDPSLFFTATNKIPLNSAEKCCIHYVLRGRPRDFSPQHKHKSSKKKRIPLRIVKDICSSTIVKRKSWKLSNNSSNMCFEFNKIKMKL